MKLKEPAMTAAFAIALLFSTPSLATLPTASAVTTAPPAAISLAAGDALGMQMHANHGHCSVLANRQAAQTAQAAPAWTSPANLTRVASVTVR
jgi:hypothetical protein